MTIYDKLFLTLYFLAIIIVQSVWQHRLFKANKPISHFWHGMLYAIGIGIAVWVFSMWWQVVVIGVVTRLAFFDGILNAVRGRPLLYNGKGTTGSLIDKIENKFSVFWINVFKIAFVAAFLLVIIKIK